jgi:cytochrome c
MMLRTLTAVAAILVAVPALAGDPKAGATVFRKCQACHAVGEGARNKVGPELNGVFGRTAGSLPDYKYSEAMKTSGIVWNHEIFAEYIKNPRTMVPGTIMAFAGLKKEKEIEDVIAYLDQFNADGTIKAE